MESNYWPHALLAALMLPTESVSYVCPMSTPPTENPYAREVYIRELDGHAFSKLVGALEQEMLRQPGGSRRSPFPPVTGYIGRFYAARDYYIFWNNCNAWTVRMLSNAGCSTSADFVFSEGQVAGRLAGFQRVDVQPSRVMN
jgi:hypothetical protein